jgi:hypothetical protein
MLKKIFFEMMVGGSWSSIREIELKWWPDRCIKRFCFAVCWHDCADDTAAYAANSAPVAGRSYLERTEKTHRIILISVEHTDPVVLKLAPNRSIDCFR